MIFIFLILNWSRAPAGSEVTHVKPVEIHCGAPDVWTDKTAEWVVILQVSLLWILFLPRGYIIPGELFELRTLDYSFSE